MEGGMVPWGLTGECGKPDSCCEGGTSKSIAFALSILVRDNKMLRRAAGRPLPFRRIPGAFLDRGVWLLRARNHARHCSFFYRPAAGAIAKAAGYGPH